MMVSPKAVKEAGDKFGLHPVCAGPYKFVERVQQDRIVFEKFKDYWNKDNVRIDRVVFLPIVDSTVRLANLKSGALELIERVLATDIKDVRADSKLKLATALELGYQGLDINVDNGAQAKNPLGQSAKVRQALNLAIDREALNQVVFNGEFKPGNQWVSPENPYYQQAYPVPKRDVAKAKALLKEAGVTAPFDVDFMVPKGAETQAVAEVMQAMAAEIRNQFENPTLTATPISSSSAMRRRTRWATATRTSTSCSMRRACRPNLARARRSTKS
jgi:peptide/nickel transport system substrate-binding protein